MRLLSVAVLSLAAVIVFVWSSTGVARYQQEAVGLEEFLSSVDVDGDGLHSQGDRAVMEWWISHGGSAQTVMSAAVEQPGTGVRDVTAFLASPAAQLN